MEIKKSSRADLERGWGLRFAIGLVVVLSVVYVAFRWKTESKPVEIPPLELPALPLEADLPPVMAELPDDVLPENVQEESAVVDMNRVEAVGDEATTEREEALSVLRPQPVPVEDTPEEIIDLPREEAVPVVVQADTLPCFPGGDAACMRFLSRHVRYPSAAITARVKGCVHVQFLVGADGTLSDFRVVEEVAPLLDREALRVVRLMPRWKPGRRDGKPARFLYVLPVDFRLR